LDLAPTRSASSAPRSAALERGQPDARLLLAGRRRLEQQRGQERVLVAVDVQQAHGRAGSVRVGRAVEPQARDPALRGPLAGVEVGDPLAAAVGPLDAATKLGMTFCSSSRIIRPY
jgi:hypothetical protein